MRLLVYKFLTLVIIILNIIRKRLCWYSLKWGLRKERDEQNLIPGYWVSKDNGILLECCDCGLSHRLFEDERGTHCIPERPLDYDYKWRFGQ